MQIVGALDVHRRQITFKTLEPASGESSRGRISPAAREPLRRALEDADPWVRSTAAWSLGRLGDPPPAELLRPLLTSTAEKVRRVAVVVLDSIGDAYAHRLLRAGLNSPVAETRRDWVACYRGTDLVDSDLLSRYGDSQSPWIDSREVIDTGRVRRMARLVHLDPAEVHRRYTRLATTLPLKVMPYDAAGSR